MAQSDPARAERRAPGAGGEIEQVYFPLSGMVSLLSVMHSGEAIETGIVGADGVVGDDAPINGHVGQTTVQIAGDAVRLPKARFVDAYHAQPRLRNLVNRYQLVLHIPIIFMTGYADIPMAVRAMKAGAVDFLTKPFREQDMLDAVTIAIERDRIRREGDKVASGIRALFETLSPREREVMALVTSGLMNKQVAAKTGLAEPTVKVHRGQVMRKMGAKSLADPIKMAEIVDAHGNNFRHRPRVNSRSHPAPVRRPLVPEKPPTDRSEILPRGIRDTPCWQGRS